ncbi:hypothetical protein BG003_010759 [Podila horticola]|nr:hypothetical protein BG003_010759 [Podila horticola]
MAFNAVAPTSQSNRIRKFVSVVSEKVASPTTKLTGTARASGPDGQTPASTRKRPLFVTEHDDIDPWIRQFNTHKGAGRLVQIWSKKLRLGKRDEDFVNNAVDVVVKRIGMALKDSKVRQGWRLPHKEVTEQKIADFLVDDSNFLLRYADKAKYLTRLLKGLLPEDGPDQSLLNKARKRHSVRRPSSIRGCIMAILIFISSQKDARSEF